MTSTNTVDITAWQDKFAAITRRAEAAQEAHVAQMTALAVELEAVRSAFADAQWDDSAILDLNDVATRAELDARTAVYDEAGYFEADNMIGFDHEGNPY